jgi:hypothetical protein
MKFFVPAAEDDSQGERVYRSIAEFNSAPVNSRRIASLRWQHNGQAMHCEVGHPLPSYYRTGEEPVLAILDCGAVYKICTASRGGVRGEAVLAGKSAAEHVSYFESAT